MIHRILFAFAFAGNVAQDRTIDERLAIEAVGRAALRTCLSDTQELATAIERSDRYLGYLIRYQGLNQHLITHAAECAAKFQPLPPVCFPDKDELLAVLLERDQALVESVDVSTLPTSPMSPLQAPLSWAECAYLSPWLR